MDRLRRHIGNCGPISALHPETVRAGGGRAYLLADGGAVGDHAVVAGNLGVACAMAGERVIVVDADLRGARMRVA